MLKKPLGQKVKDPLKPVSYSDIGGEYFNTTEMSKQMEYRGNKLVWTGLMVGDFYKDEPNPQLKSFEPKKEIETEPNRRINSSIPPYDPEPIGSEQEIALEALIKMQQGNSNPDIYGKKYLENLNKSPEFNIFMQDSSDDNEEMKKNDNL